MTDLATAPLHPLAGVHGPLVGPAADLAAGPLAVAPSGRHLVHADGRPFLWLGDTAWELFHRLRRDDVALYLDDRRAKGFTVIQAVALAELDGVRTPNAHGHLPLLDGDPARPALAAAGEDYWTHVDFVIDEAAARGLYVALLPTWGDKVGPQAWGKGPEIFDEARARAFGGFLGRRYRQRPNLVWILGGDRPLVFGDRDYRPIWRALAAGLRDGDGGAHLCGFHPVGGESSSLWLHDEPWLDFNMLQSGHGRRHERNYDMIRADRARLPAKPVLDGEPCYEDHGIAFDPLAAEGWFDAADVRQAAYWGVLAGGFGTTYGAHPVWQFLEEGRRPVSHARRPWREALDLPGAWQLLHLRRLLTSRPMASRMPDPSLVVDGQGVEGRHVEAARAQDGAYAFVYVPRPRALTLHLGRLAPATRFRAWWFDPRTGAATDAGRFEAGWTDRPSLRRTFLPPGPDARGNDWVLVIDDETRGFAPPGQP
jgi:hypothetical protein